MGSWRLFCVLFFSFWSITVFLRKLAPMIMLITTSIRHSCSSYIHKPLPVGIGRCIVGFGIVSYLGR